MDKMKVFTDSKDFSISTIYEKIKESEILLRPHYQREYVFDSVTASRLIESILLDIPIPVIYLNEEEDYSLAVIDGLQRLTTIFNFISDDLKLEGLEALEELNGKYYSEMGQKIINKFKNSTLRFIVIKKESNENLVYEIFSRLNRGSVKLKHQELRNCLYCGSYNDMLKELAQEPLVRKLFRRENKRYVFEEWILKYFAHKNIENYTQRYPTARLNYHMMQNRNLDAEKIYQLQKEFMTNLETIHEVLGDRAFCEYDHEVKSLSNPIRVGIYDSIAIGFSMFSRGELLAHKDEIKSKILEIKANDGEYRWCIKNDYKINVTRRKMIIYHAISNIVHKYNIDEGTSIKNNC
ncbi:uncharacterized protein with ParB-like and HNH nuclease domain [Methanococcus maripaludis]|uniref:Uncharacterized protein with ParB-like and HNH nuclease domain n=1 Tax=Methanococcus maripaludis TaxID=39152 RepID=A0A7J9P7D4_METMI|nr:DUF262 domain-containing protein [Methanococcus maripaludis]MBA2858657.1 uncharacterized protein with ParB-like and HNH nuclease domain [Methanococcus maripaludis]